MTEPWRPRPGYDAIVIGGGHNGLVAAALLGRAGLSVLLLEARERLGGAADTSELLPGARVPTLAHTVGRLRPSLVRALDLRSHGLRLVAPDVAAFGPRLDGPPLTLWREPQRSAEGLADANPADAARYLALDARVRRAGRVLAELARTTPPDLSRPSGGDALSGLRVLDAARRLGRSDGLDLLRLLPMAIADLLSDSVRDSHLRAVLASRGVLFTSLGPRAAGTSAVMLVDAAGNQGGAAGQTVYARGGPGALAAALAGAAAKAGVELRTGATVARVTSDDGRATGVVLESGDAVLAPIVVAAIEPKRLLTGLVDPMDLGPTLRWRASNYRTPGATAKVNLALSALPAFTGAGPEPRRSLAGRIVMAQSLDGLERASDDARYGRIPARPLLEATIPSLMDPSLVSEAAGAAGIRHVMSVIVQYAPYRLAEGDWDTRRDELGRRRRHDARGLRAGHRAPGGWPAGHHAARPGTGLRPHRRSSAPRRAGPRPVLRVATAARLGAVPDATAGPLPGGIRSASRWRADRCSCGERGSGSARGSAAPMSVLMSAYHAEASWALILPIQALMRRRARVGALPPVR